MTRLFHLFLILALTFGGLVAPDVLSARESGMGQMQMDGVDQNCNGCPSSENAAIPCNNVCSVPCGASGLFGVVTPQISSTQFAMTFGVVISGIDPLLPMGTAPSLDPFPPKLFI